MKRFEDSSRVQTPKSKILLCELNGSLQNELRSLCHVRSEVTEGPHLIVTAVYTRDKHEKLLEFSSQCNVSTMVCVLSLIHI